MVIEVTSEGSHREDQDKKKLYADLGIEEYFLDDPLGEYLIRMLTDLCSAKPRGFGCAGRVRGSG